MFGGATIVQVVADIERDLDVLEMHCRKYVNEDDFELIRNGGGT